MKAFNSKKLFLHWQFRCTHTLFHTTTQGNMFSAELVIAKELRFKRKIDNHNNNLQMVHQYSTVTYVAHQ